ncbi:MAG: AAA family ATPase [bacterium]
MAKLIIGITGLMASGKGTAAKYIVDNYSASSHRFSTMLRDTLDRYYLPHTRENMVTVSEIMRTSFGQDILAKVMAEDAKNDEKEIVVIEGIRRMADITHLSKLNNFVLVQIIAEPKLRHSRLSIRGENADDNTKTYDQFIQDHNLPTEKTIPEVMNQAKETLDNNLDMKELSVQIDNLIKKLIL